MDTARSSCPKCAESGVKSWLRTYQINLEEAVTMCPNIDCPYPMCDGIDLSERILTCNLRDTNRTSRNNVQKIRSKLPVKADTVRTVEKPQTFQQNNNVKPLISHVKPLVKPLVSHSKPFDLDSNISTFKSFQPSLDSIKSSQDKVEISDTKKPTTSNGISNRALNTENCRNDIKAAEETSKTVSNVSTPERTVRFMTPAERTPGAFLQWENKHALCWLDVCMCLLVHCTSLSHLLKSTKKPNSKSLIHELMSTYYNASDHLKQAKEFQKCSQLAREGRLVTLQTSIGKITVQMGGGATKSGSVASLGKPPQQGAGCDGDWVLSPEELDQRAQALVEKGVADLERVRGAIWRSLKARLRCELGKNDSPVFALPLIWKERELFESHFLLRYYWRMTCSQCGYQHYDQHEKNLPSFPAVEPDFCMAAPYFLRTCFRCGTGSQRLAMCYQEPLPQSMVMHFVEGLHGDCMASYDFTHQGAWYVVKAVVQYRNQPDHFVAWIRDVTNQAEFPLSQVHLVMWERLTDQKDYTPHASAVSRLANCQNNQQVLTEPVLVDDPLSVSVLSLSSDSDRTDNEPLSGKTSPHSVHSDDSVHSPGFKGTTIGVDTPSTTTSPVAGIPPLTSNSPPGNIDMPSGTRPPNGIHSAGVKRPPTGIQQLVVNQPPTGIQPLSSRYPHGGDGEKFSFRSSYRSNRTALQLAEINKSFLKTAAAASGLKNGSPYSESSLKEAGKPTCTKVSAKRVVSVPVVSGHPKAANRVETIGSGSIRLKNSHSEVHDRLQRLREKLKNREKVSTVRSLLAAPAVEGNQHSVRHLRSNPDLGTMLKGSFTKANLSPCQQTAKLNDLMAKVKGHYSHKDKVVENHQFEGYKSKSQGQSKEKEAKQTTTPSWSSKCGNRSKSPKKSPRASKKKISFDVNSEKSGSRKRGNQGDHAATSRNLTDMFVSGAVKKPKLSSDLGDSVTPTTTSSVASDFGANATGCRGTDVANGYSPTTASNPPPCEPSDKALEAVMSELCATLNVHPVTMETSPTAQGNGCHGNTAVVDNLFDHGFGIENAGTSPLKGFTGNGCHSNTAVVDNSYGNNNATTVDNPFGHVETGFQTGDAFDLESFLFGGDAPRTVGR